MQGTVRLMALLATLAIAGTGLSSAQDSASEPIDPSLEPIIERLETTLADLDELEARAHEFDEAERAKAASSLAQIRVLATRLSNAGTQTSTVQQSDSEPVDPSVQPIIGRLEASLADLRALEARARESDAAEEAKAREYLTQIRTLEAELARAEDGSREAEQIYDRVVPLVGQGLDLVEESIKRASRPSQLPAYIERLDLIGSAPVPFGDDEKLPQVAGIERLNELELRRQIDVLEALEVELRLADVDRDVTVAGRLYRLRLAALAALPLERRLSIKSWDQEGEAAIRLELRTARLIWKLQLFHVKGLLASIVARVKGFFTAVVVGWLLVRLTLVLLVWRWVRRARPRLLKHMRRKADAIDDPVRHRWAVRSTGFLAALAPWGTFLLGLVALRWAFGPPVGEIPFLMPVLGIVATYAIYRLMVDLLVGAVVSAAEGTGLELTDELQDRLRRGSRWVMRAAAVVIFSLWFISLRLGQGVLYAKVRSVGVILIALVLLAVVLRWRRQVAQMYLALKAHGWLADLLRRRRGSAAEFLVTPLAFLSLCLQGVMGLIRGIAFSFERTRAATAYLSRRQITKVADERGFAEGRIDELPEEIIEALDPHLTVADMEAANKFVGLELAEATAVSWVDGGTGGSLLLASESGLGKSSWLERFTGGVGDYVRLTCDKRLLSPVKLRAFLQQGLLPETEGALDRDGLIDALNEGPKRMVVLQRAENLFLGTVNGYRALAELGPVVDGTRGQIFWVLTMGGLAWDHLQAAGHELAFLRRKVVLETWSPREMQDLIDRRLEAAGLEISYAGLMAVEGRKEDEVARNRMGKQAFLSILQDYAGGNPEVSLHYFLRSLEVDDRGGLEVKPFLEPPEDELNHLGYDSLFLLAAVVRHGSLASRQAATATDLPLGRVEGLFLQLLDLGTIGLTEDVYRVTLDWRASVLRVLRRWNILIN